MVILFTETEGGEWIPFNTPLSVDDIHGNLWGPDDNGAIIEDDALYSPNGDLLPTFHSILLPDASRWDAANTEWTYYLWGPEFDRWWERYLAGFKLEEKDVLKFWADQGPGWNKDVLQQRGWENLIKRSAIK